MLTNYHVECGLNWAEVAASSEMEALAEFYRRYPVQHPGVEARVVEHPVRIDLKPYNYVGSWA